MERGNHTGGASIAESLLLGLLRPLAKFCVRRAQRLQAIIELLKQALVEAARDELQQKGERVTTSRVAVMTGVHRKDVESLLSGIVVERKSDLLTRIVGQWRSDPEFSRRGNIPKALPFEGPFEGKGGFSELCAKVSRELHPATVLRELERLNLVSKKEGTVTLVANEFSPGGDAGEIGRLFELDCEDLLLAVEENALESSAAPHLHLTTRYDNIPTEFLPNIRQWVLDEGTKLHQRARSFLSQFDKDLNPTLHERPGRARVSFGTFGLVSEISQTPESESKQVKSKKVQSKKAQSKKAQSKKTRAAQQKFSGGQK